MDIAITLDEPDALFKVSQFSTPVHRGFYKKNKAHFTHDFLSHC